MLNNNVQNMHYKKMCYFYSTSTSGKTPLLILHGWMQNKESWEGIIALLSKDMDVLCPDLPGFGDSKDESFSNFTTEDYSNYLFSFLKDLKIKKINILAHSFGGRIAIDFTSKHKDIVSNLILFSSAGIIHKNPYIKMRFLKKIPGSAYIAGKLRSNDYKNAKEYKNLFLNAISYNANKRLNKINVPTLILWGDKDRELNLKDAYVFRNGIKKSILEIMTNNGHFAHLENPYLFTGIIKKYLKKNENI